MTGYSVIYQSQLNPSLLDPEADRINCNIVRGKVRVTVMYWPELF